MKKRAQISMEYIIIMSVALMILIPGLYMFKNYVFESNDELVRKAIYDNTYSLLSKARKMYYYGPPSRTLVTVDMPDSIQNMYVLAIPDNNEYYLVFVLPSTKDNEVLEVVSQVPLTSGLPCDPSNLPNPHCSEGYCMCFPDRMFSKGLKEYIVEASYNCPNTTTCVVIDT